MGVPALPAKAVAAFRGGSSTRAVARSLGLPRERVRRQLREALGDEYDRIVAGRRGAGRRCVVCGGSMPAGRSKSCSEDHARIYHARRYQLDDEQRLEHRRQRARVVLRYPDRYPDRIEWARAILGPDPPPMARRRLRATVAA